MRNAVLFLIFNRADTTSRVFEAIRRARPPRLYVAADGARAGKAGEAQLCEETRAVIKRVDWPCEVKTLFRDQNLGCKVAVSQAIGWFFDNEEQGIILEDDCLPEDVFFNYCDELLERYKDDLRVMCISGDNFLPEDVRASVQDSYYFSNFCHIWGWASWRRAWTGYDVNMRAWQAGQGQAVLKKTFPHNAPLRRVWRGTFDRVANGDINTWDYQWTFRCWSAGGLTCLPSTNLISNIGFDDRATHTVDTQSHLAELKTAPLSLPLKHPAVVQRHEAADRWSERNLFPVARYTLRRVFGRRLKVALGLRESAA